MASPKKSRPKSSPGGAVNAARPRLMTRIFRRLWRPFPLLLTALALSVIVFWPELARRIPDLRSRPEYQLSWSRIEITPPGPWAPSQIVEQVRLSSGLPDPLPVLQDQLARTLAEGFARHPWVSEVRSVQATSPGRVRVELIYREPALLVRTQRGLYPVDAEGVLLPPSDFGPSDVERLPVVDGVRSIPAGPAGTDWGDQAVRGAARLARELQATGGRVSAWERFGIEALVIIAPDRPAESLDEVTLGLVTSAGSQIDWGRPPGADSLEPTIEQKLLRIEKYLPEYGSAGWSAPPVRLDVRQWDVVTQQELSREPQRGIRR